MKKTEELQELRVKVKKDLFKELRDSEKKLTELNFSRALRKIKNYHEITVMRKKIARLWTVLAEKSLAELEKEEQKNAAK